MTLMRMQFAGHIRTATAKTIGTDPAIEVSLCKKNYTKTGEEPTFTWLNILVVKPQPWQIQQLQEGLFISGSGEFTLRSYDTKDGQHKQSAGVRCSSYDIDGPKPEDKTLRLQPLRTPSDAPAPTPATDEPPF